MRVILMHNPSAGTDDHSADWLCDEVRRAGHQLIDHVTTEATLARAMRAGCDLVAVAGGDGTVGLAAGALLGTGVPFTVLALGTANNIARTLGLDGDPAAQIARWGDAALAPFDVGVAEVDGIGARFLEAIGVGAFPEAIHEAEAGADPDDRDARLARDLEILRDRLARARPRPYAVTVDGADASGDYVLVEVLNVPAIGPQVVLAASDPGDGALDVVLAGERDRDRLVHRVDALLRGAAPALDVRTLRGTRITIAGDLHGHHRDGDHDLRRASEIDVAIAAGVLRVLIPPPGPRRGPGVTER
jgi:diacylglycerol kinase (ATP)